MHRQYIHHLPASGARVCLCVVAACSLLLITPALAFADTVIYVNASVGSDATGNGSAAQPYKSIRRGLLSATPGDSVRASAGDYSVADSGEVFPLWVPPGVTVQGTGGQFGTRVRGNGTAPVFRLHNATRDTVLDGLTITGGGGTTGGGVYITGGQSPGWGPTIQRCMIGNNIVTGNGGGIAIDRGAAASCAPLIRACYLIANDAASGGGINADHAQLDVYGSAIIANEATTNYGGGINAVDCFGVDINQCSIMSNQGVWGGGARMDSCIAIEIWDSYIMGNQATYGGGLCNLDTTSIWTENCVFWANVADLGGAEYNANGNAAFTQCTFSRNEATTLGDGIRRAGGTVAVADSIMWDNNGDDIEGAVAISYSLTEEAGITGTGVIHADPRFLDPDEIYHRLLSTSPCIDTGNPSVLSGHDIDTIFRPQDGNGDGVSRVDMGASEFWLDVRRDFGDTRYSTATNMWQERMPFSHYAVIATGLNFPDALCAGGLAGAYSCPILLTKRNSLPTEVVAALEDHDVYEVFVVGGPDVVSPNVVSQLEAMGIDVTRLYGDTRYETSAAVADHIADMGMPGICLVARGDLFPDALALAPVAWHQMAPVLLVKPDSVPAATLDVLSRRTYNRAIIAGDTGAVSSGVADTIDAYVMGDGVTRLGGSTRYETAAEIAAYAIAEEWLDADFFGLATGENFPDALAGGAVCGSEAGPLLLTKGDSLRSSARTVMLSNRNHLREIYLFGGSDVLGDQVMTDCAQLMP